MTAPAPDDDLLALLTRELRAAVTASTAAAGPARIDEVAAGLVGRIRHLEQELRKT